ncbi:DUF5786 family protein [Halobaculum sp. CBA1158]|uniref:DUF5786 family protein n=1 Tax=Halobaculum sp. CBA1158 TaxID=2904243 RepID=UPI001F44972C|nr:DUF5786 family protein [Halobaculum sp. CBA1158]UIO99709.1 DUF5786 family protein [Halobaculum sp. CBA1158]
MGAYDEDEHERREEKARLDGDFGEERSEYRGRVTYESGDSTEALLDQFQTIKDD